MNKVPFLKAVFFGFITITAVNTTTSCDNRSRNENDTYPTVVDTEETIIEQDTLNNDHSGSASGYNTPQSTNRGTANGRKTSTGEETNTNAGTGSNSRTEAGSGGNSTGYGDSNSPIENSSTPAVRNGEPIRSSGAGGIGTGTGSTGNNTKITRPEDQ